MAEFRTYGKCECGCYVYCAHGESAFLPTVCPDCGLDKMHMEIVVAKCVFVGKWWWIPSWDFKYIEHKTKQDAR